ncbi:MAG: glutamate synthase subunit beta [Lentisphaerales bacterium]|jgi:glutamate synthase (NADPH/NADH) small chain|nr:MAG: glutamate synthase subunit beta [Lentisphaerales bacterium]
MGKPGGFLDFERKDFEYRPVAERLHDFKPVELPPLEIEVRAQAARCMDCGTPFCHGCGCPLANVVPELNDLVYRGRWKEAVDLLLSTDNFPEFTSRVCPAPCECACVLDINDDPVSIRQIEMAISEKGFEKGYIRPRVPMTRFRQKIAVIGSGPSGLATADTLNRAGYNVTVYERGQKPGGILRYGIPDFKLEKRVVDRRIALMVQEGVVFETGVNVGEDISCNYLNDRFDAICIAGGARLPRDLKVPGHELTGIHFAMAYLTRQNQKLGGESVRPEDDITAEGKAVAVIGGGDTGSDCLGTALRQGARKVELLEIMPRPPDARPDSAPWPGWAGTYRESSSNKEGGARRWCVATSEFIGKEGAVCGMKCVEVEWKDDGNGRKVPSEVPGTGFDVEAQLVLLSLGFAGPGNNKLVEDMGVEHDAKGNIKVDERHMTTVAGVFAAGDMSRGQSLIVRAIADGQSTARGMIEYLGRS